MLKKAAELILGQHPNNTFFSYNWHNVRHINKFNRIFVQSQAGQRFHIADIGGGKSPYYPLFAPICDRFTTVDMADALPENETRPIHQVTGIAEDIPLDDGTVDLVLCNQVLEHVSDPEKACEEIYRILKPGGIFIGSVPHVSPIHLEPHDYRRYTQPGLQELLQRSGYREPHIEGNCGVFSSAAFMISMDMIMSRRKEGEPQQMNDLLLALTFPLVGLMNILGLATDALTGNRGRTPSNLCWTAVKPNQVE